MKEQLDKIVGKTVRVTLVEDDLTVEVQGKLEFSTSTGKYPVAVHTTDTHYAIILVDPFRVDRIDNRMIYLKRISNE